MALAEPLSLRSWAAVLPSLYGAPSDHVTLKAALSLDQLHQVTILSGNCASLPTPCHHPRASLFLAIRSPSIGATLN